MGKFNGSGEHHGVRTGEYGMRSNDHLSAVIALKMARRVGHHTREEER